jgi:hypothetical protein
LGAKNHAGLQSTIKRDYKVFRKALADEDKIVPLVDLLDGRAEQGIVSNILIASIMNMNAYPAAAELSRHLLLSVISSM